jgi:hypothetical protein
MHEHVVTPDIVWEIAAAELARPTPSSDLSLDVAQHLSPLVVKPQRTWRPSKSFTLDVPQQVEDRRRHGVTPTPAPNGLADANDFRVRTAAEGNFWLNHSPA